MLRTNNYRSQELLTIAKVEVSSFRMSELSSMGI